MDDGDAILFFPVVLVVILFGGILLAGPLVKQRVGAKHTGTARITQIGEFTANRGYSYEILIGTDTETGEVLVSKTEDKKDVLFIKEGMIVPYVNYEHDKRMCLTPGDLPY